VAGPTNPAVASTVLPPITWSKIVDENGLLTPAGLNLFQQIWAGVYGSDGLGAKLPVPGDLKPTAATVAPTGWLFCNGASYPTTTYPALFAAIGSAWGTGGVGTFRVPNLTGRFPIGADVAYPIGTSGGNNSFTLSKANLPNYNLTVTDPGHAHGITDPQHHHSGGSAPSSTNTAGSAAGTSTAANTGNASTGITINTATTGITVASGGSGTPIDITPSYAAINWLIKT